MHPNRQIATFFMLVITSIFLIGCAENHSEKIVFNITADSANQGEAINEIREILMELPKINADTIVFLLENGNYFFEDPLTIVLAQKPDSNQTIVFKAKEANKAIFNSLIEVIDWKKNTTDLPNLPSVAKDKIFSAIVPESQETIDQLWVGNTLMPRAKSELFMPEGYHDPAFSLKRMKTPKCLMQLPEPNQPYYYLSILPKHKWIHNILPIGTINTTENYIEVETEGTYELDSIGYGWFPDGHAFIDNFDGGLDQPGKWFYNHTNRTLYFWPRSEADLKQVKIPSLTEFILIEGKIDNKAKTDSAIKNICFEGITFTGAQMYHWQPDHRGNGLQHDWEMYDKPTAMLRFRGANNCSVKNCNFINSASAGIRLDLSAQNNSITNCNFVNLGGTGVLLAGYGPGLKDVNKRNIVSGNTFDKCGTVLWHSPAIFLWQSGENLVEKNYIKNLPYSAIILSGRITWDRTGNGQCAKTIRWNEIKPNLQAEPDWHDVAPYLHTRNNIIKLNEIVNVMNTIGDGNSIYLSGAGANNHIEANYMHDNYSLSINSTIRSDDHQYLTYIEKNIIANTIGEGIMLKGTGFIRNNILYNLKVSDTQGQFTEYRRGYIAYVAGDLTGTEVKNNLLYSLVPKQISVFIGKGFKALGLVDFNKVNTDSNIFYNPNQPQWSADYLTFAKKIGKEINSTQNAISFANALKHDFSITNINDLSVAPNASEAVDYFKHHAHDCEPIPNHLYPWPIIKKMPNRKQTEFVPLQAKYLTNE